MIASSTSSTYSTSVTSSTKSQFVSSAASSKFSELAENLLNDMRCDSEEIAKVIKAAFAHRRIEALNKAIRSISAKFGRIVVSEQVKQLLLEDGIELVQHCDDSVSLTQCLFSYQDERRQGAVGGVLSQFLPDTLIALTNSYDRDQYEFSARNSPLIKKVFESDDALIKSELIRNAVLCLDQTYCQHT